MIISFIIPAYNEEERIAHCISAIKDAIASVKDINIQTEIIVVNNASIDNTKKIANSFSGVNVVDEPHKGLVWARHAGFVASRGDILANIDADTLMSPKWLDTVIKSFNKDEKLLALSGPYIYYDTPKYVQLFVWIFYAIGFSFNKISQLLFNSGSMLQGGNFVLRRRTLEIIGGFDRSIEFYGEDTDIGRRVGKIGKVRWTFKLPMKSSGRRFMKQGLVNTGVIYTMNFIWITFLGKPYTKTHIDFRIPFVKK